jgi:hypothetical protein
LPEEEKVTVLEQAAAKPTEQQAPVPVEEATEPEPKVQAKEVSDAPKDEETKV